MSWLEVERLAKSYGSHDVLHDLDLALERGSFTSILGPSGSGKTTLLRLIAGFERPDGGSIRIGSRVVEAADEHVPPERRGVGYVPQEGGLFPHLSVEQNVGFGLPRRERHGPRVRELLEMTGLEGLARRYPHQLSGGQQQRVALARALAIRPQLVLLDEPFSSLDASLRSTLRREVRCILADAGTTALLVTHDQDEALSLGDCVAVLGGGRIAQLGSPSELYATPATPAIALALGECNFVPARADGRSAATPIGVLELTASPEPGDAVHVAVRPEQIVLVAADAGAPGRGTVTAVEYYGHDAVVRVRPSWDEQATVVVRVEGAIDLPPVGGEVGMRAEGCVVGWNGKG